MILTESNGVVDPKNSITLRHLLTQTAGYGYWFTSPQLAKWNILKKEIKWKEEYEPRLFESETSVMYGTNIDWVGVLMEKTSGMMLEDYFRTQITGPLEMDSTWINVPEELELLFVSSSTRIQDTGVLAK